MRALTVNEIEQVSGGKINVLEVFYEWVLVKVFDAATGAVTYIWERRDTTVEVQMGEMAVP